jgi:release factor glutamine methyltransferase
LTVREALAAARRRLQEAGIEDSALEAEVLLRHALGLDRAGLFSRSDEAVPAGALSRFDSYVERRLKHEPTAYITGVREFFGIEFEVSPAVLIPRPETETLVEAAIELARPRSRIRRGPVIADIGTGSGAVAIALALNVARSDVYAVDSSAEALAVARRNAERLGADRVLCLRGDLLTPLPEYVDVLVANLPYVRSDQIQQLAPEVREYEPRAALDGGPDGLTVIGRFLRDAPSFLRPNGAVCLEFGDGQTEAVRDLARRAFPGLRLQIRKDLAGRDRVLIISP